MKRLLLFIMLTFVLIPFTYGQIRGGLKGGVNISDFIITKSGDLFQQEQFSTRVSYHIGSYVQQSFTDRLAWQIEVLFSNKGYTYKFENSTENISLNYLNWPLLLVYKPIKLLELEFGPELGYLISGEDLIQSFDVGIDIGARFNISPKFLAGIRYSNGFPFKLNLDDSESQGYDPRYQNSVLQFYIGFNLINENVARDDE
ncbi:MAG: PorT family protein [Bacteroidales bacterium]|nr:PorT family protein [Bacteroidales bacterium]